MPGQFECGHCRAALTAPLRPLPDFTLLSEEDRQPHVPAGYYACAAGRYDYWTSAIGTGNYLLHLGDLYNVKPHPDALRQQGCCGPAGDEGKNLLCAACGSEVATAHADCHMAHFAELAPADVVLITTETPTA